MKILASFKAALNAFFQQYRVQFDASVEHSTSGQSSVFGIYHDYAMGRFYLCMSIVLGSLILNIAICISPDPTAEGGGNP
uniref:Uncharacterized protein n=1 Tax=Panagrolaimus sp. JU765 TaxID=591449 RepID=A0AC34PYI4_9BILA